MLDVHAAIDSLRDAAAALFDEVRAATSPRKRGEIKDHRPISHSTSESATLISTQVTIGK